MYLLDTNIWLEYLLDQENADEVEKFLKKTNLSLLYISDFSLFSIGIITQKFNKIEVFEKFIVNAKELIMFNTIRLDIEDFHDLIHNMRKFNLDFDDAYQLTCAKKVNLTLISYDSDFNKTDIKRIALSELLKY